MTQLSFPLAGASRLDAVDAPTFPAEAWNLRQRDWAQFLVHYRISTDDTVRLVAPSRGKLNIVSTVDPKLLIFKPLNHDAWISPMRHWLAPAPNILAFSFDNFNDEEDIRRGILFRAYSHHIGRSRIIRSAELGEQPLLTARLARKRVNQELSLWAEGRRFDRGPLLRQNDLLYTFDAAEDRIKIGLGHVQELGAEDDTTIYSWNWFDGHEFLLRMLQADAFAPPVPEMSPEEPENGSFRVWHELGPTDVEPVLKTLTGGAQEVQLHAPSASGLPIIPAGVQFITSGVTLEALAFHAPSAWEHELDYTAAPEQPDRWTASEPEDPPPGEPTTLSPDPEDASRLEITLSDLRIDWTERGFHQPVGVWLKADDQGPAFLAYKDPVNLVSKQADRVFDARENLDDWLAQNRNAELFDLAMKIKAIIRALPADEREDIVNIGDPDSFASEHFSAYQRFMVEYGAKQHRLREQIQRLADRITSHLFTALTANPSATRMVQVKRSFDALALTEEGQSAINDKLIGFLDEELAGEPVMSLSHAASLWNNSRSIRGSLASLIARGAWADLNHRVKVDGRTDATLRTFRERLKTAFANFEGLQISDADVQLDGRTAPGFVIRIDTSSGPVDIYPNPWDRVSERSILSMGNNVSKLYFSITPISNAVLVLYDGYKLIEDPGLGTTMNFANSLSSLVKDAAALHPRRELGGRVKAFVDGAGPVFDTMTVGDLLVDISRAYRRDDEDAVLWLNLAVAAAFIGAVAPVGPAVAAVIGIVTGTFQLLATLEGSYPAKTLMQFSAFGSSHSGSVWENNLPMQIAQFNGVLYPMTNLMFREETLVADPTDWFRIKFTPTVCQSGSIVTFDLWRSVDYPDWDAIHTGPDRRTAGTPIPGGQFAIVPDNDWHSAGFGEYRAEQHDDGRISIEILIPVSSDLIRRTDRATITVTLTNLPVPADVRVPELRGRVANEYGHAVRVVLEKE